MRSLSKILLPVDFSERSLSAARYVKLLAGAAGAEAILLHVAVPLPFQLGPMEGASMPVPELYRNQMNLFQKDLESLRDSEFAGRRARTVLLEGDPAARIVEFAHREEAGLIVMPTHGYGPLRRFILGSNTAKVLHDADCPVWTGVHLGEARPNAVELSHILCAIDLGPQSVPALTWADGLRKLFGARLSVMHATAAVPPSEHEEAQRANLRWAAEKELQRVIAACQGAITTGGMPAPNLLIESGEPAHAICEAAVRLKADVIVIGRGSAAGVFGRLRTNAYAIIRQSACPVVSV
ncbi:MAG TPA: universal stress protein [Bryobacteraceae bacterium]|nr:universal stress protein [Bryobacteraceae bacterium]